MAKVGVVADDLTGANDTGVQFAKKGLKTIVSTQLEGTPETFGDTEVIVLDTESRADTPSTAYQKVRTATRTLKRAGVRRFYKKIDSTLRGNIGRELDAILDELGIDVAIVVPAFPKTGRITVGGYQLVNQVPLERTEIARDPVSPVTESHAVTLIGRQTKRSVGHISLSTVLKGVDQIIHELEKLRSAGKQIVVVDATTQHDLKVIAEATAEKTSVFCGPAGLAEELPTAWRLLEVKSSPVLVVAGSASQVTVNQLAYAAKALPLTSVQLDLRRTLARSGEESRRVVDEALSLLEQGRDVAVTSADSSERVAEARRIAEEERIHTKQARKLISSTLARITAGVLERTNPAGIVVTGGDTLMGVFKALGADGIRVEDEVLPGMPVSTILGGKRTGLRVVTKAGAFGPPEAIVEAVEFLKKRRSTS